MKLTVDGFYGECWCPSSMMYCEAETDAIVLEINLNPEYDCDEMQMLLREIDSVIRQRMKVRNF